ncbi:MAG: protoglobin domain-containing protein [Polyangiaceae bacterium]
MPVPTAVTSALRLKTVDIPEELQRYVRFTDDDARRLRSLRDLAAPHFEDIVGSFYERVREHEGAHAVLADEAQVARMQRSLVAWLERLLGGTYDAAYFEHTRRIGMAHVRAGLPPRYVPVAMSLIREALLTIADGAADAAATRAAVCRILDIELAVMMESHREDMEARLDRIARQTVAGARPAPRPEDDLGARSLQLAGLATIGLGPRGEIVMFDGEAARLTGYAADEALGRSFEELLLLPDDHAGRAALEGVTPTASAVHEAGLVTRSGKLGQVRWIMARLPEMPRVDGELVHLLLARDISQERNLQQRARVEERLAAMATLATGLAHEIRNPLNGAQLHVSVLERALRASPFDAKEGLDTLGVVRDEIQRLSWLVADFLEFARPRPLQLSEVSLSALCRRVVRERPVDTVGRASVQLDLPAAELSLEADGERLAEVLGILIDNAVEAVAPGGRVVVRARREPHRACLEVEDDGAGIDGDTVSIFDAFYTTKATGTGLGLTIAHRVVSDHGGTLQVDSKPGLTRFRVTLPLQQ